MQSKIVISVRVSNEPGMLAKLVATLLACGTRIFAIHSRHDHRGTIVRLIAASTPSLPRQLKMAGFSFKT